MSVDTTLAEQLKTEDLTLEDKLALIDKVMNDPEAQKDINRKLGRPLDAPVDPADATACLGCQ